MNATQLTNTEEFNLFISEFKKIGYILEIGFNDIKQMPSAALKSLNKTAKNYIFRYIFNNEAQMLTFLYRRFHNYSSNFNTRMKEKAKAKELKSNFINPYKVGDILNTSWGYDQTNVDFYIVTKASNRSIEVVEIGQTLINEDWGAMSAIVNPNPNKIIGEPITKLVNINGSIKISSSQYASLYTNGEKGAYCSWGH